MIDLIVGGQLGSEGKGALVSRLIYDRNYRFAVRVGAPNAGHTAYNVSGEKFVTTQIPLAPFIKKGVTPVIGPGALISLSALAKDYGQFDREVETLIDRKAHIITDEHIQQEQDWNIDNRIGSTSAISKKGIGAAEVCRVKRAGGALLAKDVQAWPVPVQVVDTSDILLNAHAAGNHIMIEGSQGFDLSLYHGTWPYVTSRDTTASGILAQCGLSPTMANITVWNVLRTFPIRVAGNSGPFPEDCTEIKWEDIGVEAEKTTVTKNIRRVATFSLTQAIRSTRINGAGKVIITFWDYLDPDSAKILAGMDMTKYYLPDSPAARAMLRTLWEIEVSTGTRVVALGCGPKPQDMFPIRLRDILNVLQSKDNKSIIAIQRGALM